MLLILPHCTERAACAGIVLDVLVVVVVVAVVAVVVPDSFYSRDGRMAGDFKL